MPSNRSVVGIGEVLMDVFENGEATVGGAPFNVIFHLNQLMRALSRGEALFLSAVGKDAWGGHIRTTLAAAGISTRYLEEAELPTGSARVVTRDGGAGFEIQDNVAWDAIQLDNPALDLARSCDAVVFGTLAQRSEISRSSIRRFVSEVTGHRLFDVNLRRNTGKGLAGYNAEIIAESLKLATLVKMNDAELDEVSRLLGFSPEVADGDERTLRQMDWLRGAYALDAVAITRGSKGALLATEEKHLRLPDSDLDQALVHPVGAGDSFAAGLLFGLMEKWTPEDSLKLANLLSSWVVQHLSATPALPEAVLSQIREVAAQARHR